MRNSKMEQNKPSVTDIIDRMKTVLGITMDKELSEALGGSRGFISVIKNRGSIPYEECITLALDRGISLDWLLLGRGTKEAGGAVPVAPIPAHLVELPFMDLEDVELRNQENWYVGRDWLGLQGLAADATVAVRVVGDAMENTLPEGQVVLVDLEQQSADGVYLVRFGGAGAAYFRRVQHMADGSLRLSCDNPAYADDIVPAADRGQLNIIGCCHSVVRVVR
jgi:hypothetical protein